MITEEITFSTHDGIEIEGAFDFDGPPRAAAVLCHPHPQMGGTMNAPLMLALRDDLVARKWAVVRFNFRGIGRSSGTSGDGTAEVQDALAAVRWLEERRPDLAFGLAGWSFGGAVAVRAAAEVPEAVGCAVIAPAVRPRPGVTAGLPNSREMSLTVPVLAVSGANDAEVSPADVRQWVEAVHGEFVEVPGANHFFWAKYDDAARIVGDWLDDRI